MYDYVDIHANVITQRSLCHCFIKTLSRYGLCYHYRITDFLLKTVINPEYVSKYLYLGLLLK